MYFTYIFFKPIDSVGCNKNTANITAFLSLNNLGRKKNCFPRGRY